MERDTLKAVLVHSIVNMVFLTMFLGLMWVLSGMTFDIHASNCRCNQHWQMKE